MKVTVKLGDLKTAIQMVGDYKKNLKEKCREFLKRLGELGVDTADVRFRAAQYDGTNDVTVSLRWESDNKVLVVASGHAVTFIEFGTGIVYVDDHPKAGEMGAVRGGYGEGHGSQRTWGYYGDPGTNGKVQKSGVVLTHGNPASRALYETGKELREKVMEIAKEVFGT